MSHLEVIERALQQYKGDDAERARRSFSKYTPDEMQQVYAMGKTRAEVLAGYEKHEAEVEAALAWVRSKS